MRPQLRRIMASQLYCIEGNIGVGKSTLLRYFQNKYICFPEPLHEWTLLDKFYEDKSFEFAFQYQVLLSQFNTKVKTEKITSPVFVERCPWTSRNVFLNESSFSPEEICVYDKFYEKCQFNIKKMFFLKLSPEKCMERIRLRNRFEERNISIEYIRNLDQIYNEKLLSAPFEVEYIFVENKNTLDIYNEVVSKI